MRRPTERSRSENRRGMPRGGVFNATALVVVSLVVVVAAAVFDVFALVFVVGLVETPDVESLFAPRTTCGTATRDRRPGIGHRRRIICRLVGLVG